MSATKREKRNPWAWVPSLYFAEGLPYVIVMTVSVIMYKRLGISNAQIALYTSWLYLPWVIKPLWSPVVDLLKTKRYWIFVMQLFVGAGLAGIALTIPVSNFFRYTLAFFWLLAFSSATHDIAADGLYMLGLTKHEQAFFVGIRNTFYRIAMLTGQGLLVILAGHFETSTGLPPLNVQVLAETKSMEVNRFDPDTLSVGQIEEGTQGVLINSNTLIIPIIEITNETSDSILSKIRKWNIDHGFYSGEVMVAPGTDDKQSWWNKHVTLKLEAFLKKNFGEDRLAEEKVTSGNIGMAWFTLSKKPETDKNIIVNFRRERGDKSIMLVEGFRFTFNKTNWNVPACFAIQLDPKLSKASLAQFTARSGNIPLAWSLTFVILAGLFILFSIYHKIILPYPKTDVPATNNQNNTSGFWKEFFSTFASFFKKKEIGVILAFLLLYRLGESQLVKLNLPNLVYVYLSHAQPESLVYIYLSVAIEQLGYGFGFTAYTLYMIYISEGKHKTAHFAITTGFMALGMMIPGMISGWLQEVIGYPNFFIWVMICTIPSFMVLLFVKIDPEFGIKKE